MVTSDMAGTAAWRRNQGTGKETRCHHHSAAHEGGSILCGEAGNIAAMEMFDAMLGRSLPWQGRDPKGRTPLRGKCGSHPVKHDPRSHPVELFAAWVPFFFHPSCNAMSSPPSNWSPPSLSASPPYVVPKHKLVVEGPISGERYPGPGLMLACVTG